MDETDYEEIISTLAKCGRPDLIQSFKENVRRDYDYKPTAKEKREAESEDCSEGESEELNVAIDDDGFYHLTSDSDHETD